jgi:hypothetical protein
MAGPVEGSSKTRLIGTGFKPYKNATVQAKWGIINTDTIPKSLVEDYIYYKTTFESMIDGCEELKAYWYEATQFERVDTIMEEGGTYHAVYMQTPEVGNWTKTHGGPYYVEVGKNIEVAYHVTMNVTYRKNTTTTSSTLVRRRGSTSTTSTSASTSTSTDISVNVTTSNSTNDTSGNDTSASNDTSAGNGTSSGNDTSSVTDNSTTTTDNSTIAATSNSTSNASDIIKVVEEDVIKNWTYYEYDPSSVEYYYYKDSILKDMQPHSGIIAGGTPVSVVGAWFKYMPEYGVVPHCKFGEKIVRAMFDSTVRIVCRAPPNTELGVQIPFEVSMNGVDWSDSGFKFTYYETPTINSISPICGPEAGGTMIYLYGSNFTNMSNPSEFNCKFSPTGLNVPPKKMPGIYLNSSTIMCASPGGWGQGDAVKI